MNWDLKKCNCDMVCNRQCLATRAFPSLSLSLYLSLSRLPLEKETKKANVFCLICFVQEVSKPDCFFGNLLHHGGSSFLFPSLTHLLGRGKSYVCGRALVGFNLRTLGQPRENQEAQRAKTHQVTKNGFFFPRAFVLNCG